MHAYFRLAKRGDNAPSFDTRPRSTIFRARSARWGRGIFAAVRFYEKGATRVLRIIPHEGRDRRMPSKAKTIQQIFGQGL